MLSFLRRLLERQQLPESLRIIRFQLRRAERPSNLDERHLSIEDQQLLQWIRSTTAQLNVNNITRTKAYLDFHGEHPEIHWAFLGHMVSRNGGWNMTDLKGEFLTRLMTDQSKQDFFSFLERGN